MATKTKGETQAVVRSRAKGQALLAAKAAVRKINFRRIKLGGWYSTREAAQTIGVSPRRLRTFCEDGRLRFRRGPGGSYEIKGSALATFARNPRPTGRAGRAFKSLAGGSKKALKKSA